MLTKSKNSSHEPEVIWQSTAKPDLTIQVKTVSMSPDLAGLVALQPKLKVVAKTKVQNRGLKKVA